MEQSMHLEKHLKFFFLLGLSLVGCTRESCQTPANEPVAVKNATATTAQKDQNEKPANNQVDKANTKIPDNQANKDEKSKKAEENPSNQSPKSIDPSKTPSPEGPTKSSVESTKDKQEAKKASNPDEQKHSNSTKQPEASTDTKK